MGSWAQSSAQLLGRVCTHVHKQQPRNGLEMRLERVNNCLPDSPVQFCEMLLLPRGTKYNFALKVNSIRLTEGRKERSGSSFIRIPACALQVAPRALVIEGNWPLPAKSCSPTSPALWQGRSLSRDSEVSSTEFKLNVLLLTSGKSQPLTREMQVGIYRP